MKELKDIVDTLKNLMSFQTVEGNDSEFQKLFDFIKTMVPPNLFVKEYEFGGRKAMVIANTKDTKLDLVFCTHIDVVPASTYEWVEDETKIMGRGTFDMKGSVAVCLNLLEDFDTAKKVALFITSDEEISGYCAKQLLTIYEPDFAIVPDGGKNFQIVEEEKGQLQLKLSIKTKSAHASQPYNGINAIVTLYKIYEQLIQKYPLPTSKEEYQTSVNLSMLSGGEAPNSVAENANMVIDIRHTSKDTKEEILSYIESLDPTLKIEIMHAGSLFRTDISDPQIQKYIKISEKILGKSVEIVSSEATSDAIYFSDKNIPTVLTNPVGDYAHAPLEYIEKESLYQLYLIWKEMLKENEIE